MEFEIHKYLGLIFALYILFDRLYLRKRIEREKREKFYKISQVPLGLMALAIIATGMMLLDRFAYETLFVVKGALGLLLIALFFACPLMMQKLKCDACKVRYRGMVSLVLLVVLALGIYIPS